MTTPTVKVCQDFVAGDSFDIVVTHNPGFDITDAEFDFALTKCVGETPALHVTHTVPAGADATAGTATITVDATDTADLAPGKYYGTLKRTLSGGQEKTILRSGLKTSSGARVALVEVFESVI
jgi:hypothetical protein